MGQDLFDEVWEDDYHFAPVPHARHGLVDFELAGILRPYAAQAGLRGSGPCNIGKPDDYRVPDQAYFTDHTPPHTFNPSAEIVVEIVSPGDESRLKYDFYFRAGVAEVVIVDPQRKTIEWFVRDSSDFRPAERGNLLNISTTELAELINWPQ